MAQCPPSAKVSTTTASFWTSLDGTTRRLGSERHEFNGKLPGGLPGGVIKSGCGLSSWKWGQECPQNPQAGKPALGSADILVCGFGRLSSRLSLTHF